MSKNFSRPYTNDGREIVASCTVRNTISAPRKVKLVADLVRGKTCGQALEVLRFTHRPSGTPDCREGNPQRHGQRLGKPSLSLGPRHWRSRCGIRTD